MKQQNEITTENQAKIKTLVESGQEESLELACKLLDGQGMEPRKVVYLVVDAYLDTITWEKKEVVPRDLENPKHKQMHITCGREFSIAGALDEMFDVECVLPEQVFVGKTTTDLRPFVNWVKSFLGEHGYKKTSPKT